MPIEAMIQYSVIAVAILFLIIKRKGMKKYLPVGLFAAYYAFVTCQIAMYFNLWQYPSRFTLFAVDFVVTPIAAMFWVRYYPLKIREKILWAFGWTAALTLAEFLVERFTNIINYYRGYAWYHSYLLWFISFFIWLEFHLWFNGYKQKDSLF